MCTFSQFPQFNEYIRSFGYEMSNYLNRHHLYRPNEGERRDGIPLIVEINVWFAHAIRMKFSEKIKNALHSRFSFAISHPRDATSNAFRLFVFVSIFHVPNSIKLARLKLKWNCSA